ncbi:MAG: hypothetical protein AAGH71_05640 [Planctomycetota bacterium]
MKIAIASAAALVAASSHGQIVIDDFDGGGVAAFNVSIDNSANNGAFPSSGFDVFGITDRTVSFDFADDSAGSFPADEFGLAGTSKTDRFFGVADLSNNDNPGGTGSASWTLSIAGLSNLAVSIEFAAMGDFEAGDNSHTFTYSIDGAPAQPLFTIDSRDDVDAFPYQMEGGAVVTIDDPLEVQGQGFITNSFNAFTASVIGSGSSLTINYEAGVNNGGFEPFAFDNLILIPTPASAALLGLGGLAAARRRR